MYRAAVAASVGALEESIESLCNETVQFLDRADTLTGFIQRNVSQRLQAPNSNNIRGLLKDLFGIDIRENWTGFLQGASPPKSSPVTNHKAGITTTLYNRDYSPQGKSFEELLDCFVHIRHSFAHQDLTKKVLTPLTPKPESLLKEMARGEWGDNHKGLALKVSCVCCVKMYPISTVPYPENPVVDWWLRETHAWNAFKVVLGSIARVAGELENYLAQRSIDMEKYAPMTLHVPTPKYWDAIVPDQSVNLTYANW